MRSVWVIDADGIEAESDGISNVFRTRTVNAFLNEDKKLGIAAVRGLGKTFLLKVKRKNMQLRSGTICMPSNSMVDVVCAPKFNNSNEKYFNNYNNWVLLWQSSISLSIINELRHRKINTIDNNIKNIHNFIVKFLLNLNFTRPSEYFNYIISMERKNVNILFDNVGTLINSLNKIHIPIYIFIDKIDQALSNHTTKIVGQSKMSVGPRNASFWQYAQLSLSQAAYDILSVNPHIKVYYSIRKEALVDAEQISYVFQNMREYYVDLDYRKNELEQMFIQYIEHESNENLVFPDLKDESPVKSFLGLETINSNYVLRAKEKIFNYILRHTFMRPRDIMDICYQLYLADLKNSNDIENDIKIIVNRESRIILEILLSESDNNIDITRKHIEELSQLISYNIINKVNLKYLCQRFNDKIEVESEDEDSKDLLCSQRCDQCGLIHPFCHLYNIGLIGSLWESRNHKRSIRFKNINEIVIGNAKHCLPASDLYFLHPCFASRAEHIRKNSNKSFEFNRDIIVGNEQYVSEKKYKTILVKAEEYYENVQDDKIFISSTCFDLKNERNAIDNMLTNMGLDVVRSDGKQFNTTLNGVHSHDHCINELKKCKFVIFIIGKRYGGEYCGTKYQDYKKEISEIDNNLSSPSISLLEYYVACKQNIETHVFVDSNIYNERLSYKNNIRNNCDFFPAHAKDNRIFHVIDFVTKQPKNNWLRQYNDLQSLCELIRIEFESKSLK